MANNKSHGPRAGWPQLLVVLAALALIIGGYGWSWQPGPGRGVAQSSKSASSPKPAPKPKLKPYEFPDGGRQLFPGYRLVALYGTPDLPALGVLGQQPLPQTIARVKALAKAYQPYSIQPILPTLEIIATVASGKPTSNDDYSAEQPLSELEPWVDAAAKSGVYVVLDLQSGRSSFLKQAKEYSALLEQPNVGLALDPEWRLTANEFPLEQIGTVSITEINQTADWLANLTKTYNLPQKLLLLQQFRLSMIPERAKLDTSHADLAYAIQMDGSGTPSEKLKTWRAITAAPPPSVHFGWKNFYRVDRPTWSPAATMSLKPQPWYVSYQ